MQQITVKYLLAPLMMFVGKKNTDHSILYLIQDAVLLQEGGPTDLSGLVHSNLHSFYLLLDATQLFLAGGKT